jgi:hypothetical protein
MKIFKLFFIALLTFSFSVSGALLVNPKRIVLSDGERGAALDLLNEGDQLVRYQIFFEQKIMTADGAIVDLPEDKQNGVYAKDMIRYSPRRVDIAGGGRQTIRIAARRPKDLVDGEYLSHLVFKEIPIKKEREKKDGDETFSVSINPVLKIAIPIIVRKGELSAVAALKSPRFDIDDSKNGSVLFQLVGDGDASLYGDVEVFEIIDGEVRDRVAYSKGVALYTNLEERLVRQRLNKPLSENASALLVRYDEDEKYGGSNFLEYTLTIK